MSQVRLYKANILMCGLSVYSLTEEIFCQDGRLFRLADNRLWALLSSEEGLRTYDNRLWAVLSSVEGLSTCIAFGHF